jgi:hypothetical protein
MTMLENIHQDVSVPPRSQSLVEPTGIEIGLNAAIVSILADQPQVLLVRQSMEGPQREPGGRMDMLPSGLFAPREHGTLDVGVRSWVQRQTGLALGYAEQLCTFGDRGGQLHAEDSGPHIVSVGYLALTRIADAQDLAGGFWRNWYVHLPWEDWRDGKPEVLADEIEPRLRAWANDAAAGQSRPQRRIDRVRIYFGLDGAAWDEERVLERYEVLYEAGLLSEAKRDQHAAADRWDALPRLGQALRYDHRRILATAMGRLRAKIKYRPLIFDLMAKEFTLFELQKTVEAILGSQLHKQNFRRLVESAGLVELTGEVRSHTGGRPAKLFRFRRDVLMERPAPGVRVKVGNA